MPIRRRIQPRPAPMERGFVLPLALSGAMVLLLSSLSLQAAALQAHRQQGATQARRAQDDQLASAAQLLAADLQGPYHCLQGVPSSQWHQGLPPASCPPGLDPEALRRRQLGESVVWLRSWQPGADGQAGALELQLGEDGLKRRLPIQLAAPATASSGVSAEAG